MFFKIQFVHEFSLRWLLNTKNFSFRNDSELLVYFDSILFPILRDIEDHKQKVLCKKSFPL